MKKLEIANFEIYNVSAFNNELYQGICFSWTANIGFGQYTISQDKKTGKWEIDDECLDNENRKFGRLVLDQFLKDIDSGKIYEEEEDYHESE